MDNTKVGQYTICVDYFWNVSQLYIYSMVILFMRNIYLTWIGTRGKSVVGYMITKSRNINNSLAMRGRLDRCSCEPL